jgi:hypothetical protein
MKIWIVSFLQRALECRRGDDYDHFAGWIKRLYDSSPVCKKIAREVAEESKRPKVF